MDVDTPPMASSDSDRNQRVEYFVSMVPLSAFPLEQTCDDTLCGYGYKWLCNAARGHGNLPSLFIQGEPVNRRDNY